MDVLVDTSVWIDYFRSGKNSKDLDVLIDENIIATNDLILVELVPFLKLKKQVHVIRLLQEVRNTPLNIDWEEIMAFQLKCLKNGSNGIGIPDLIIAQNARQHNAAIYSLDKHFRLLNKLFKVRLYPSGN